MNLRNIRKDLRAGSLVTAEMLVSVRACPSQLGRFRNVYPKGVRLGTRNLNTARSKYGLSTMFLIYIIVTYDELDRMFELSGVRKYKDRFSADEARLIHSAFIKVLKERE